MFVGRWSLHSSQTGIRYQYSEHWIYFAFNHALNIWYDANGSGWWWQQNHSDSYKQVTYPIGHYFYLKCSLLFFFPSSSSASPCVSFLLIWIRCRCFSCCFFMFCFCFFFLMRLWGLFHLLWHFGCYKLSPYMFIISRFSLQRSIVKLIKRNANFMNEI